MVAADVRVVLEVDEIDPSESGYAMAPSTVLYDGVHCNVSADFVPTHW